MVVLVENVYLYLIVGVLVQTLFYQLKSLKVIAWSPVQSQFREILFSFVIR